MLNFIFMLRNSLLILMTTFMLSTANAEEPREVFHVEIDAHIDDVWQAFTTTEGLQSWVAPLADIDFKVGGKWRANYDPNGTLGDASTIENTILSYDPKRMISLKATGFPKDFIFEEAAKDTWSVFYFSPITPSRTKITVVGLGYNETELSQKMRSFFQAANQYSMDQLKLALNKQSIQE